MTFQKNIEARYTNAATIANARAAVTAKPSTREMLTHSFLVIGGALATFAIVWNIV